MRKLIGTAVMLGVSAAASGQARDCNELKAEIDARIRANGVATFTLTIVDREAAEGDARVVGTCGGGTKKILYRRGATAPAPAVESVPKT